ncbi:MAG: hypothetical protein GY749_02895 [Desulfobacteraceae bacterium]|nr:hypothetical protein [Desulfobacteraceae bacterium]
MNALPEILLDYQKVWVEDPAATKILVKSRRIGGSWSTAAYYVLYAAAEGKEGGNVLYIAYNKHIAREFIEDCAAFAEAYETAASEMEEEIFDDDGKGILTYIIRFASGYRVEALSSSPKGFREEGRNRPVIIIDEAAYVENFDQVLKSAIALKIWGAKILVLSSHNGTDNPFNEFVEDVRAGKRPGVIHEYDFERAIRDGLCKRIFAYTDRKWTPEAEKEFVAAIRKEYGDDAEEELDCVPSKGEGAVFTRMMIKNCMDSTIPILRWEKGDAWEEEPDDIRKEECEAWCRENLDLLLESLNEKRRHWFGEDFARNRNLTVIWPGYEKEDTKIRVPFAVELANIPFKQQIQILFYILDRLPRFAGGAMDARATGSLWQNI